MATRSSMHGGTYKLSKEKSERTVLVFCQGAHELDTAELILYFQNGVQSGGGPVEEVADQGDDTLLVTFNKREDAERVVFKDHHCCGIELLVTYFNQDTSEASTIISSPAAKRVESSSTPPKPPEPKTQGTNQRNQPNVKAPFDDGYIRPLASHEVKVSPGKQRYLTKHHQKDLEYITKRYLQRIDYSPEKMMLRGLDVSMEEAVRAVEKLLNAIDDETFSISRPRVLDFLNSPVGQENIRNIEDVFKCAVDVDESLYACIDRQSDLPINVIYGDLSLQQADVLVDTVGPNLDLSGGVLSASLLRMGGAELQQHCTDLYPRGVQYGGVVKTPAGRLNCKQLYHCCLPEWTGNNSKDLEDILHRCLMEASQSGHSSIAFPAVGTGNLNYPPQVVAKIMLTEIKKFQQQRTSLDTVTVVLFPSDVTAAKFFKTEMERKGSDSNEEEKDEVAMRAKKVHVTQDEMQIGNMKVQIKQGDITREDTDCIVNSTDSELQLARGVLSKTIRDACGSELDLQCNLKLSEMKKKGVIITTAPRLPSNYIIHVAIDHFHGNIKELIKTCLKTAHDRDMTSIALPPLGTGVGSLPIERMCKILIASLREFGMKNTTLKEIRVVIYEKEKHDTFLLKLTEIVEQTKKEMRISRLIGRKCKITTPVKDQRKSSLSDRELPSLPAPEEREPIQAMEEPVDQMTLCNVDSKSEEAELTIYSPSLENRRGAYEQIVQVCLENIVKTSFLNKKIKLFNKAQLLRLREFMKEMNMNIVVHPGTEKVEVEGLKSDVDVLESYLSDMVDNLAYS